MEYLSFNPKNSPSNVGYDDIFSISVSQISHVGSISYNVRPPLAIAKLVHNSVNFGLFTITYNWQPSPCNLYGSRFFPFSWKCYVQIYVHLKPLDSMYIFYVYIHIHTYIYIYNIFNIFNIFNIYIYT